MGKLLLLFIVLPAVELMLLIEVGKRIGTIETLLLIVVTGSIGASLARRQGLNVLRQVQSDAAAGRVPAGPLVDGIIILLAGALLVTPGVLTDAFGFLCLVPQFRSVVKEILRRRLESTIAEGGAPPFIFSMGPPPGPMGPRRPPPPGAGPVVDVTPDRNAGNAGDAADKGDPR